MICKMLDNHVLNSALSPAADERNDSSGSHRVRGERAGRSRGSEGWGKARKRVPRLHTPASSRAPYPSLFNKRRRSIPLHKAVNVHLTKPSLAAAWSFQHRVVLALAASGYPLIYSPCSRRQERAPPHHMAPLPQLVDDALTTGMLAAKSLRMSRVSTRAALLTLATDDKYEVCRTNMARK